MDTHQVFSESTIRNIEPEGWLRRWLETQKHGLTGHCEVAGFPFDSKHWACPAIPFTHGSPWWPYEQTAYLVDGYTRCGHLLRDQDLMLKAQQQIDYVLAHADDDGYLGPDSCKEPMPAGRWSHMIFFRAMIAHYQATGDKRIVSALVKHFLDSPHDHSGHRDVCSIEILAWLCRQPGVSAAKQRRLVALAEQTWADYIVDPISDDKHLTPTALAADEPAHCHGVTFLETAKQPAFLYQLTGNKRYLTISRNAFRKIDKHHMLIDGVPSSHEALEGRSALDPHETCDIADFGWSAGHMLMITGEADWADKIERAAFNAAPGAVTKDFKALQYFSGANQVVLARNSAHSKAAAGSKFMCYRPKPGTECCTGEVNRIIPNYITRMWLWRQHRDRNEPCAACYGPSRFAFTDDQGQTITIIEETGYPFAETVDFRVACSQASRFGLWLRIPGWCDQASLTHNGKPLRQRLQAGRFVRVEAAFQPGDRLSLRLPMPVRVIDWPAGGWAIERGPLLYALKVAERREIDTSDPNQSADFPAWEMFPASPWNYALDLPKQDPARAVEVVYGPAGTTPYEEPPVRLRVPAKRVPGWKLAKRKVIDSLGAELLDPARNIWNIYPQKLKGDFLQTPGFPSQQQLAKAKTGKQETIELVPYGCTCLRIALFPRI